MANTGTNRELLERLIVSELISKRGEGPLARKHFTRVPRMLANAAPSNEVASALPAAEQASAPLQSSEASEAPEIPKAGNEADEPKDPA